MVIKWCSSRVHVLKCDWWRKRSVCGIGGGRIGEGETSASIEEIHQPSLEVDSTWLCIVTENKMNDNTPYISSIITQHQHQHQHYPHHTSQSAFDTVPVITVVSNALAASLSNTSGHSLFFEFIMVPMFIATPFWGAFVLLCCVGVLRCTPHPHALLLLVVHSVKEMLLRLVAVRPSTNNGSWDGSNT